MFVRGVSCLTIHTPTHPHTHALSKSNLYPHQPSLVRTASLHTYSEARATFVTTFSLPSPSKIILLHPVYHRVTLFFPSSVCSDFASSSLPPSSLSSKPACAYTSPTLSDPLRRP
jgi:hypothetical protein